MTFSILAIRESSSKLRYEIAIGDERETAPLVTTLWEAARYEGQWAEALRALVERRVSACVLITDIQPAEQSYGIMYWALFTEGDTVFLQERFLRDNPMRLIGSPEVVEQNIPPRVQSSAEEHALVSEWEIGIDEVANFVASLCH